MCVLGVGGALAEAWVGTLGVRSVAVILLRGMGETLSRSLHCIDNSFIMNF